MEKNVRDCQIATPMSKSSALRQVIQSREQPILDLIGNRWGSLAMQVSHQFRNFLECGSRKSVASHPL